MSDVRLDRVLFVDDDTELLDGIARRLRNRYEVWTAPSARNGLYLMRTRGPFAVVVSDMRMPEMQGPEFLLHVAQAAPTTVRMVLSGHADVEMTLKALDECLVFRYLLKPLQGMALEDNLREAVDEHRRLCETHPAPAHP